jgi:glycosyltransferase involved in cell wall biosynthesis
LGNSIAGSNTDPPVRIYFFILTDVQGSEHIYLDSLRDALGAHDVVPVDSWQDADVVHLFEVNFLTGATLRAFQFPRLLRIIHSDTPLVVSTDDLYFADDPTLTVRPRLYPLNHRLQRWLLNHSDMVIAISDSVRENLEPHVTTPIHVVHHGVEEQYRSEPALTDDPFVLHVSLAAPRKNPEAVRAVAERLDSEGHRFVIAGSGWADELPGNLDNVKIPGYVPEDELVDLYHRASVFYFPTLHEGFGLPVLEAMAAGTAVVTSDVYSVPEVAGDAALLVDPDDTAAHAEAIRDLLSDGERRHTLAERAVARADEFSWKQAAAETKAVYRTVTKDDH